MFLLCGQNRLFLEAAVSANRCYESSVLVRSICSRMKSRQKNRLFSESSVSIVIGSRCSYCDRKASVFVNICYESYQLFWLYRGNNCLGCLPAGRDVTKYYKDDDFEYHYTWKLSV